MKEGDVILVSLLQADGLRKPRPAIILRILPPFDDYLVCGVSNQLRRQVRGLDAVIARTDSDFAGSGLQTDSLIRVGFLAVYAPPQVIGSIGEISSERHRRLLKQLAEFLVSTKQYA
jgi:mRNA interferase MazF